MTDETSQKPNLVPLTKWPEKYEYPPLGQLRALVFNEKHNGFDKCVRRVGRRVLISVPDYFEWVVKP